jgi:hypothetical protein
VWIIWWWLVVVVVDVMLPVVVEPEDSALELLCQFHLDKLFL